MAKRPVSNAIGFFWAQPGELSHGWDKRVYLVGNHLGERSYRDVIYPQTGVGIINVMVLLAHEATHAGYDKGHNCPDGVRDTNLAYMGAWAVQYYLLKLLSENTPGGFFTPYQTQMLQGSAQEILATRFCNNSP
jgi:hypothetical protein